MAEFTKHDCTPTVQEIESAVIEDGGLLMGFGGSFCCPGNCPPKVGDWTVRLVDRRGCGNQGVFVAIADTPETVAFQVDATKKVLRQIADEVESRARNDPEGYPEFVSRGNIDCRVIPIVFSRIFQEGRKGTFLFGDEKWLYFSHSHGNYLRAGDDRERIWVRRASRPVCEKG